MGLISIILAIIVGTIWVLDEKRNITDIFLLLALAIMLTAFFSQNREKITSNKAVEAGVQYIQRPRQSDWIERK